MDAATPTHERSRELADLRRRAYGPDADIQRDPEALRRLHELEELALPPDPDTLAPSEPPEPAAVDDPPGAASDSTAGGSEPVAAAEPARWWHSRRLWLVAAVSLTFGLAAGATAVAASSALSAGGPDTTLDVVEWSGNVDFWGMAGGSIVSYENYDDIQVFTGRNAEGGRCLLLGFRDRIFTMSCAIADLDPVLDLSPREWPAFLEGALNPGGVLRFVARTDGVDVWLRPAAQNSRHRRVIRGAHVASGQGIAPTAARGVSFAPWGETSSPGAPNPLLAHTGVRTRSAWMSRPRRARSGEVASRC